MTTTPCLLCGADDPRAEATTPPHLAPDRDRRFHFVRCRRCGLIYLNPRPEADELERYYGPGYLPHRGPDAWGRWAPLVRRARRRQDRKRVREARRALADGPGSETPRVLDVGCGRPTFLRALVEATGARGTGVDTSDAGWRDRPHLARGLELETGNVREADLEPGFDLVTLWHVLEHAYQPRPLLESLRALARPGGAIVVEVPDHTSLPRRVQGSDWIGYDAPRHAAVYSPATLRRALTETGWRRVRVRRHGTVDPWVLWWLGRQVGRGRTLEGSLEGDFIPFVLGKVLTWKLAALQRWVPLGAMTARARAPEAPSR